MTGIEERTLELESVRRALEEEQIKNRRNRLIGESQSIDDILKTLAQIFKGEIGEVDSISLLRIIPADDIAQNSANPARDFVHILAATGVYEEHRGLIFPAGKTLSGVVIKTAIPQHRPNIDSVSDVYLPEGVSREASEFALPIFGVREEQQAVRGILYLRREEQFAFDAVKDKITGLYESVKIPLAHQLAQSEGEFDDLCRTILAKRVIKKRILRAYEAAKKSRRDFTLLFLDMDDLKQYNNKLGHKPTDAVLFYFGEWLRQSFRTTDIVGRFGGDEFILGLPDITPEEAVNKLTERKEARLDLAQTLSLPEGLNLSFSGGAAGYLHNQKGNLPSYDDLVQQANSMMYRAKEEKEGIEGIKGREGEYEGMIIF